MAPGFGLGSLYPQCPHKSEKRKKKEKNYEIQTRHLPWRLAVGLAASAPMPSQIIKKKKKITKFEEGACHGGCLWPWRPLPPMGQIGEKEKTKRKLVLGLRPGGLCPYGPNQEKN